MIVLQLQRSYEDSAEGSSVFLRDSPLMFSFLQNCYNPEKEDIGPTLFTQLQVLLKVPWFVH